MNLLEWRIRNFLTSLDVTVVLGLAPRASVGVVLSPFHWRFDIRRIPDCDMASIMVGPIELWVMW